MIRVVREARATGAGSLDSFSEVISGRIVVRASGSRRVRNNVEACRYVLDMCEDCFAELGDESDDIEEARTCCGKRSDVGAVAAAELSTGRKPLVDMMKAN